MRGGIGKDVMDKGILYALLCLVAAAVNDFVFKLYARKKRPQGIFVSIIGVVWLIYLLVSHSFPSDFELMPTIFWGCLSGFFSAAGNILLIAAMRVLPGGVCSTIYRLNLVPVILGAWLFLGETLTPMQWVGAFCALCAVVLFSFSGNTEGAGKSTRNILIYRAFTMVVIAMLMRAGMGLSYRYGFQHGANREWVTLINSLFWIAGGPVYALFAEKFTLRTIRENHILRYGVTSGMLVALTVVFMALSLQNGAASVVLPIAQMSFLATWFMGLVFLHEKFNVRVLFALACGTAAVILLSL